MFKLTLIQTEVTGGAPHANIDCAEHWIERAAKAGAAVTLLPEALNLGWMHPSAATMGEPIPSGPISRYAGLYVYTKKALPFSFLDRNGDRVQIRVRDHSFNTCNS